MGLDMYLRKTTYVGANYEHRKVTGSISIKIAEKPIPIQFDRISYIEENIGYWRKDNHIHKWFVTNCQNGEDDCEKHEVTVEKAKLLLETCQKVKDNHELAEELLPREEGFFFGSTDYDEDYFTSINDTIEIVEKIINENDTNTTFYYQSSW